MPQSPHAHSSRIALLCLAAVTMVAAAAIAVPIASSAMATPVDLQGATLLAHAAAAQPMTLVLALRLAQPEQAQHFAEAVSTPGNALYRRFITPGEFADRFAVPAAEYAALVGWAKARGLTVNELSRGRTMLSVNGTAAQVEAAFGVRINTYRAPEGTTFYAAEADAVIPAALARSVTDVIGLSNRVHHAPLIRIGRKLDAGARPLTAGGTGVGGAFSPTDLRTAYNIHTGLGAPTETVALYEEGGYFKSDVESFIRQYGLPDADVRPRLVNGYGGGVNDSGVEGEAVLDIDMVLAINPGVKRVLVYEDGADNYYVSLLDSLTAMANDNAAATISISYGLDERIAGRRQAMAENTLFEQLAAQGQAVFVSSGDGGAYGRIQSSQLQAPDPGSQPFVTSVGGTSLTTDSTQHYAKEEVWNDLVINYSATGGGVSAFWKLPPWQLVKGSHTVSVAHYNGGSDTKRNVPDLSAVGDPFTGVAIFSAVNGGWLQIGGTSVSAPIVAAEFSLLNQAYAITGLGRIGFYNPLLYRLQRSVFSSFDVWTGNNGDTVIYGIPGFNGGPGYDNTTGWGSPSGNTMLLSPFFLMKQVASLPSVTDVSGTSTSTSIMVKWKPAAGASGYLVTANSIGLYQFTPFAFSGSDSATVSGLSPNTFYQFYVFSLNKDGVNFGQSEYIFKTKAK